MAKRPQPGKCVHCLKDPVERNWDHVFPESWYPDGTPENIEKWQIPSCIPCNSEYGRIESDLLSRLGLGLEPQHHASYGIVPRVLRSMNPGAGRDERDRALRAARGKKILQKTLQGSAIPIESVIPGMGLRWDVPIEEQIGILIPAESLKKLTYKIVRGICFLQDSRFIEPPYDIDFFLLSEEGAQPVRDALTRFGEAYARPPGLVVRRVVSQDDGMTSLFEITFWQQFKTYASVEIASK